jgi:hypothetical protein
MRTTCAWCNTLLDPEKHGGNYCSHDCIDAQSAYEDRHKLWRGAFDAGLAHYPNLHDAAEEFLQAERPDRRQLGHLPTLDDYDRECA